MTSRRLDSIRRRSISDLAVVGALVAVVGVEIASLVSVADELSMAPGGLVLDARGEAPGGLAVNQPERATAPDSDVDRLARGQRDVIDAGAAVRGTTL